MTDRKLEDGEPCRHPGCLHHITHPCEGCGRIGGVSGYCADRYEAMANPAEYMARRVKFKAIVAALMPACVHVAVYSGANPLRLLVSVGQAAGSSLDDIRLLEECGIEYLESKRKELPLRI